MRSSARAAQFARQALTPRRVRSLAPLRPPRARVTVLPSRVAPAAQLNPLRHAPRRATAPARPAAPHTPRPAERQTPRRRPATRPPSEARRVAPSPAPPRVMAPLPRPRRQGLARPVLTAKAPPAKTEPVRPRPALSRPAARRTGVRPVPGLAIKDRLRVAKGPQRRLTPLPPAMQTRRVAGHAPREAAVVPRGGVALRLGPARPARPLEVRRGRVAGPPSSLDCESLKHEKSCIDKSVTYAYAAPPKEVATPAKGKVANAASTQACTAAKAP